MFTLTTNIINIPGQCVIENSIVQNYVQLYSHQYTYVKSSDTQ